MEGPAEAQGFSGPLRPSTDSSSAQTDFSKPGDGTTGTPDCLAGEVGGAAFDKSIPVRSGAIGTSVIPAGAVLTGGPT